MKTQYCSQCGTTKSLSEFHKNNYRPNKVQAECKSCQLKTNKKNAAAKKLKMIEHKGGVCYKCKGIFHPAVFELHHRDPKEKDIQPRSMQYWKWERIIPELDKCDLLCANCHRLTHVEMRDNDAIQE